MAASGAAQEKRLINLFRGWPSPHLLPAELLKAAANRALSDPSVFVPGLQYHPDPGYPPLQADLATWLGAAYGVAADPKRICVTGGASQSIACILQCFTDPEYTQAVWAIAPCYYLACPIFEDSGLTGKLRALPEDAEGIDLDWLEQSLESYQGKGPASPRFKGPEGYRKIYRHIIYCVPTCANPSGKTMSLRRRERLVHLARKYDALIISDDVYDFLQWPVTTETTPAARLPLVSPILPRLTDIDRPLGPTPHDPPGKHFGHALSNGSFSKLLGPGVRTGWVEACPALAWGVSQTGSTRSGGPPSQLAAVMVKEVLGSGELDRHLENKVRPALQARHSLIMAAIKKELGALGVHVLDSAEADRSVYGGYFVWVKLPPNKGVTAEEIADRALQEENLIIAPGNLFEVRGDEKAAQFPDSIRLTFSWEDVDVIVEGVARLGTVLKRVYDGSPAGPATADGRGRIEMAVNDFK